MQKLFTFSTGFSTANTKRLRVFPHGFPHFPPSFPHLRGKPCYTCRNQNQIFPANFGAFPCLFAFFIKSRPAFSVLFSGAEKSFSREEFFSPEFSTPGRFSTTGTTGALFHTFVKNRLWKSPFPHREQRSKTIRFCVISPQKTALLWGGCSRSEEGGCSYAEPKGCRRGQTAGLPACKCKRPFEFCTFLHHIVENQHRDLEIEDQAASVHDGGDERSGHDRRVCTQLLSGQGQHTAHQLCQHDADE